MSEKGQESVFMVRNRFGLTKEQAKKLYYDYHGAGEEQTPDRNQPEGKPQTAEEKISMIMDYMKETSAKLDQIENDIAFLKQQVNEILKRL